MKPVLSLALTLSLTSAAGAAGIHPTAPPPVHDRPCCFVPAGAVCHYIVFSDDDLSKGERFAVSMGQQPLPPIDSVAFRTVAADEGWQGANRYLVTFYFAEPFDVTGGRAVLPDQAARSCQY